MSTRRPVPGQLSSPPFERPMPGPRMLGRRPRGYEGAFHETLGSDILAIPRALERWHGGDRATRGLIEKLLPSRLQRVLAGILPDSWYPIEVLLELTDVLDDQVGTSGLRKIGRMIFELSHSERVVADANAGLDIVHGIDAMYHHANRGERIGGWTVMRVDEHAAHLEKNTPHHCALEEGILAQALSAVGCRAIVQQRACFREGAELCEFEIVWLGGRTRPSPLDGRRPT